MIEELLHRIRPGTLLLSENPLLAHRARASGGRWSPTGILTEEMPGPDFTGIVRTPDGSAVTLIFNSRSNKVYAVDFSQAMNPSGQAGGWVELTDSPASAGDQTIYADSIASNLLRAFYRVREVTSS